MRGLLCWEIAAYLYAGVIQWRRRVYGRDEVIADAEQLMGKRAEDTEHLWTLCSQHSREGLVDASLCLLLGRKVMTNLDSILKSRDMTLPTKVCLVKAMVFPVVMYGCESWTVKKAEHQKIDAFELWCGRRLLRVPWTARRPNQSILKEISPGCSLEGLMQKLKL